MAASKLAKEMLPGAAAVVALFGCGCGCCDGREGIAGVLEDMLEDGADGGENDPPPNGSEDAVVVDDEELFSAPGFVEEKSARMPPLEAGVLKKNGKLIFSIITTSLKLSNNTQ